jgi:hypothetical protein
MQFDPVSRAVVDFTVPWNDPRCEFTTNTQGTRTKPSATRFYDYVIFRPDTAEVLVLSLSNTKIKVASKLNSLLMLQAGPTWNVAFEVSSVPEKNEKGKFYNFRIAQTGPSTESVREAAAALFERFKGRTLDASTPDVTAETDDNAPPF